MGPPPVTPICFASVAVEGGVRLAACNRRGVVGVVAGLLRASGPRGTAIGFVGAVSTWRCAAAFSRFASGESGSPAVSACFARTKATRGVRFAMCACGFCGPRKTTETGFASVATGFAGGVFPWDCPAGISRPPRIPSPPSSRPYGSFPTRRGGSSTGAQPRPCLPSSPQRPLRLRPAAGT